MSNLLLENFIKSINSKRVDAIQTAYEFRMDKIKKQIANIPAKVKNWNEVFDRDLKAEVVKDGLKTECDTRSHFARLHLGQKRSIKSQFSFFQNIFVLSERVKGWVEDKQYAGGGYNQVTHEIYTLDKMENIEKEIMMLTKMEINEVFDMYLARVTTTVKQIDYCNTIVKCDINTFELNGYPTSTISIATENNTECEIKTSIKWNCSKYGKIFGQYPTTIHNQKRNGEKQTNHIFQVASDNFNHVWTEMKAHEKNEKTQKAIIRLEEELSQVEKSNSNDEYYDAKYFAKRVKRLNERLAKEKAKLIDVRAYRDVGQSLLEVA